MGRKRMLRKRKGCYDVGQGNMISLLVIVITDGDRRIEEEEGVRINIDSASEYRTYISIIIFGSHL